MEHAPTLPSLRLRELGFCWKRRKFPLYFSAFNYRSSKAGTINSPKLRFGRVLLCYSGVKWFLTCGSRLKSGSRAFPKPDSRFVKVLKHATNVLKLLLLGWFRLNKSLCVKNYIKLSKFYHFWGRDLLVWRVPTLNPGENRSKSRHDSPQPSI